MKIVNAKPSVVVYVETDGEENPFYTRHGKDTWMNSMGEREEPVYDCEELEALFQEWLRSGAVEYEGDKPE